MRLRWLVLLGCSFLAAAVSAQTIQLGDAPVRAASHVVLLTDAVQVAAAKSSVVELRFRVEPGYHINSHTPKDELLIPTVLTLDGGHGVSVAGAEYPKGSSFRLDVGEGESLDVYQGEFRVLVRLSAAAGASTLTGSLRYQACDHAACFPPRTLPVVVAVTAR